MNGDTRTIDDIYNGYERCFKNDICVGCPYSDLLMEQEEVVYPLKCVCQLMHDVNKAIANGELVTEVICTNPHRVILRKAV